VTPPVNGPATRPLLSRAVPGCRLSKALLQRPRRSVAGWARARWSVASTTLLGAAAGAAAGGLFAEVEKLGVPKDRTGYYAEALRRGGTLVFLRLAEEQVDEAMAIMERHQAVDIEERAEKWRRNPPSD